MTENEILENSIQTDEQKKKKDKDVFRLIALLCVVGVIGVVLFVGMFVMMFFGVKHTESYAVAYEALVASEEFLSSGISEEDIKLINYSINTGVSEGEAIFVFRAEQELFTVYCERKGDVWSACEIVVSFLNDFDFYDEIEIGGDI